MTHHDYDEWRPIRRGATRRRLMEASLVLTAVDVTHVVIRDEHDWCIKVPNALEARSPPSRILRSIGSRTSRCLRRRCRIRSTMA